MNVLLQLAERNELTLQELEEAKSRGDLKLAFQVIDGKTVLFYSIQFGNRAIFDWLIENSPAVDRLSSDHLTIKLNVVTLKTPTTRRIQYIGLAAFFNRLDMLKRLLKVVEPHDAKKRKSLLLNNCCLHFAAVNSSVEVIDFCLQEASVEEWQSIDYYKSLVNSAKQDETPLDWAILVRPIQPIAMQMLYDQGIGYSKTKERVDNWAPLHEVCQKGTLEDIRNVLIFGGYKQRAKKCNDKLPIELIATNSHKITEESVNQLINQCETDPYLLISQLFQEDDPHKKMRGLELALLAIKIVLAKHPQQLEFQKSTITQLVDIYFQLGELTKIIRLIKKYQAQAPKDIGLNIAAMILTEDNYWSDQKKIKDYARVILTLICDHLTPDNELTCKKLLVELYKKVNEESEQQLDPHRLLNVSWFETELKIVIQQLQGEYAILKNPPRDISAVQILENAPRKKLLEKQIKFLNILLSLIKKNPIYILSYMLQINSIKELIQQKLNGSSFLILDVLINEFPSLNYLNTKEIAPQKTSLVTFESQPLNSLDNLTDEDISALERELRRDRYKQIEAELPLDNTATSKMIRVYNSTKEGFRNFINEANGNDLFDGFLKFGNIRTKVKQPKREADVAKDEAAIVTIYKQFQNEINQNTAFIALHRTFLVSKWNDATFRLFTEIIDSLKKDCNPKQISDLLIDSNKSPPLMDRIRDLANCPATILKTRFHEYITLLQTISEKNQFENEIERRIVTGLVPSNKISLPSYSYNPEDEL